ncbi:MAG: hypothetical protein AAFO75_09610, partial [Pseudomonadota bacterium]
MRSEVTTYIRFVVGVPAPNSGVPEGPFYAAGLLRDDPATSSHEADALAEIISWFNENLDQPLRFNRTSSKARGHRIPKGLCWFKPTAEAHISKIRELSVILEANDLLVSQITTRRPGYIVYE